MELRFLRMKKSSMSLIAVPSKRPGPIMKTYPHAIYAYDVTNDGTGVTNQRLFTKVSPGFPDGMRLDFQEISMSGLWMGFMFQSQGKIDRKDSLAQRNSQFDFWR